MCGGSFLIVNNVAALKRYQDRLLLGWLIAPELHEIRRRNTRRWWAGVPASSQCCRYRRKLFISSGCWMLGDSVCFSFYSCCFGGSGGEFYSLHVWQQKARITSLSLIRDQRTSSDCGSKYFRLCVPQSVPTTVVWKQPQTTRERMGMAGFPIKFNDRQCTSSFVEFPLDTKFVVLIFSQPRKNVKTVLSSQAASSGWAQSLWFAEP